jgi:fido (protein-threonine AMPylation protein)
MRTVRIGRSLLRPDAKGELQESWEWYCDPASLPVVRHRLLELLKTACRPDLPRETAIHLAADVHELLVNDHFFADGNGRTARMVADWILMAHGLPPADHSALAYESYMHNIAPPERSALRDLSRKHFGAAVRSSEKLLSDEQSRR